MAVTAVPTNQPMVREDNDDKIYRFAKQKTEAILEDVREAHARASPCCSAR